MLVISSIIPPLPYGRSSQWVTLFLLRLLQRWTQNHETQRVTGPASPFHLTLLSIRMHQTRWNATHQLYGIHIEVLIQLFRRMGSLKREPPIFFGLQFYYCFHFRTKSLTNRGMKGRMAFLLAWVVYDITSSYQLIFSQAIQLPYETCWAVVPASSNEVLFMRLMKGFHQVDWTVPSMSCKPQNCYHWSNGASLGMQAKLTHVRPTLSF